MDSKKRTIHFFSRAKKEKTPITAVTAYDYPSARLASDAGMDVILVGDSLSMVIQGHSSTIPTEMDQMIYHARMVTRARPISFVVGDMPYGSFHVSPSRTICNALRFIKEGGVQAVKIEGGRTRFPMIQALIDAEIPVMGHLGLTPQSIHRLGYYRIQGRKKDQADAILEDAVKMQEIGVFALILEAVPEELSRRITASLDIPTIGIGAGRFCDGQILVWHDLLGLSPNGELPRFARRYLDGADLIRESLLRYRQDVRSGNFPAPSETYHPMDDPE